MSIGNQTSFETETMKRDGEFPKTDRRHSIRLERAYVIVSKQFTVVVDELKEQFDFPPK